MNKKINKNLLLMFLCVIVILGFRSSTVQAAMADEAEDYELGENFSGSTYGWENRYYKFQITEKSHVTMYTSVDQDPVYYHRINIYNATGRIVLKSNDLVYNQNATTGIYKASQYRILPKGTYYLYIEGSAKYTLPH